MPAMTALELKRKKAERVDEFKRLSTEFTKEGASPTPEQSQQLDGIYLEIENGGNFDRQIRVAEQFAVADRLTADGGKSSGLVADPLPHEDPANTRREVHQYSMLKAIRERVAMMESNGTLTGLEKEVHEELSSRKIAAGGKVRGVMIPNNLPVDIRAAQRWAAATGMQSEAFADLDTTAGAGMIPTNLSRTMVDILRARMVTVAMGAQVMDGMQGLFAIPRQSTATTFFWVTQGASVGRSTPVADQIPFAPHTGGCQTLYTRQLLEQAAVSAEEFVRADQAAVIARGIETAGLNGAGSAGQPLGIMQNPLIPLVAVGANGGIPTFGNLVALETAIATANADMGSLGYVTDAAVRGLLKVTAKIGATFPVFIWDAGMVNEYKVGITNLLPANLTHGTGSALHAIVFGNWNDMIYAYWSGTDVVVDPYTAAGSGGVIVTTLQDVDVNIRHPESFAKMMDVQTP